MAGNYQMKDINTLNQAITDLYFSKTFQSNFKQLIEKFLPGSMALGGSIVHDNIEFYKEDKKIFSIRIDLKTRSYRHIDFYQEGTKRPYKRAYLNDNRQVIFVRYYELGTWRINYDVYYCIDLEPIYTIEYFKNSEGKIKKRFIDWKMNPGALTYSKATFLKSMESLVSNNQRPL